MAASSLSENPVPEANPTLLGRVQRHVESLFDSATRNYPFHHLGRVQQVCKDADRLADAAQLAPVDREVLLVASWFLLSGFAQDRLPVREASIQIAKNFLSENKYPPERLESVISCMRAAPEPPGPFVPPSRKVEELLSDAAVAYLSKRKFLTRADDLRDELEIERGSPFTDYEWHIQLVTRFASTRIQTPEGRELFGKQREKNLIALQTLINEQQILTDVGAEHAKILGRGVDTLFRTQIRNLSSMISMADKKAHIAIGVNSVLLSVAISGHLKHMPESLRPTLPLAILLIFSMAAIIFSVLVIRPTTPDSTKVSRDDVMFRHGNLLTHMIFSDISYADFREGMRQLMTDEEYLYDSLTQNIYVTARVLNRKYKLLQASYSSFIVGIILSALSFIALSFWKLA